MGLVFSGMGNGLTNQTQGLPLSCLREEGTADTYCKLAYGLAATVIERSNQFEELQRCQATAMDQEQDSLIAAARADMQQLPAVPLTTHSASEADLPPYQVCPGTPAPPLETSPGTS
jgi:hypothetical protein